MPTLNKYVASWYFVWVLTACQCTYLRNGIFSMGKLYRSSHAHWSWNDRLSDVAFQFISWRVSLILSGTILFIQILQKSCPFSLDLSDGQQVSLKKERKKLLV